GFGDFSRSQIHVEWDEHDSTEMRAAANYINGQSYREALHVLNETSERSAKWFYFSAAANFGMGNQAAALQQINQAISKDSSNARYRQFKEQIQGGKTTWYEQQSRSYGRPIFAGNSYCLELCAMNLFCNLCCGGRFCFC
ncbi:MAG: molecular chaperone DnaJ, partial [Eubacteriales bacterium]|nr:molecular chaperone DnaJ [Eubacteriales bacterium]